MFHISPNHSQFTCNYPRCFFFFSFLKILCIYFQREGKWGRKKGREASVCGCLSCVPKWGPGPQPRHVPWLGIELLTLWFPGRHSIHLGTPARARTVLNMKQKLWTLAFVLALLKTRFDFFHGCEWMEKEHRGSPPHD